MTSWKLQPVLGPDAVLQIYVEDCRPIMERERVPTTEYVYTGIFGTADRHALDVADEMSQLIQRYSGAYTMRTLSNPPSSGLAIIFKLEHWYARAERNPKEALVIIQGEFSGTMTLQRDRQILSTHQIRASGVPTVVDRTKLPWETDKTPDMVLKGLGNTANSSQQKAYYQMMDFWQDAWPVWSK